MSIKGFENIMGFVKFVFKNLLLNIYFVCLIGCFLVMVIIRKKIFNKMI